MSKTSSKGRQTVIPGLDAPQNIAQEAAVLFIEAEDEKKRAQDRANDRKEDMVRAAAKLGVDVIKVRDRHDNLVIFDLTNKVQVKKSTMTDIKIEKQEPEMAVAAGGTKH